MTSYIRKQNNESLVRHFGFTPVLLRSVNFDLSIIYDCIRKQIMNHWFIIVVHRFYSKVLILKLLMPKLNIFPSVCTDHSLFSWADPLYWARLSSLLVH